MNDLITLQFLSELTKVVMHLQQRKLTVHYKHFKLRTLTVHNYILRNYKLYPYIDNLF
jgi:hypothetical protein